MFYNNSVEETRRFFYDSWDKFKQNLSLLPLENQIATVIAEHPEYQAQIEISPHKEPHQAQFFPELGQTNPYLHMGLHLAVRDQLATGRPAGILNIYETLLLKQNKHEVEHLLMDQLAECLWTAQRNGKMPSEQEYLQACEKLLFNSPHHTRE